MKKLNLLLLAFLVVMGVTFQSCDDGDGYSLGDVAVDWATVNVKGAHVYDFTGDRWGQIWPATTDYFWYSPIDGQRVILYFNPLYDNYPEGYDCSVKVLNIKEILTKPIEELTAENEETFGTQYAPVAALGEFGIKSVKPFIAPTFGAFALFSVGNFHARLVGAF